MKLIKAMYGGAALTVIAILLQLIVIVALVWAIDIAITAAAGTTMFIGPYTLSSFLITAADIIIALIVTVRIVIRDMSPDEKLRWLVVLLFAPCIGSRL